MAPQPPQPNPPSSYPVGVAPVVSRTESHRDADAGSPADSCTKGTQATAVTLSDPVTFRDFTTALGDELDKLDLGAVRATYQEFAQEHGLDPETPGLFKDYSRLRILFEATRDGGYWHLRWDITNQEPSAAKIWHAWQSQPLVEAFGQPLATAECDELSALYALLARRLGVDRVGLFYPTWNHTIAAWALGDARRKIRVALVPTTQIFLGCNETFDTKAFRTQMTSIEPYPRWDIRDNSPIPKAKAAYLLEQVRVYGPTTLELQALLRARRALELNSSMGRCVHYRSDLGKRLQGRLTCADRLALRYFAEHELQRKDMAERAIVEFLAAP